METEADTVGMVLLTKVYLSAAAAAAAAAACHNPAPQACIDPHAMVRVFETFQKCSKKRDSLLATCVTLDLSQRLHS
jgi:3-oxoacyl-ACP reductase-like protein